MWTIPAAENRGGCKRASDLLFVRQLNLSRTILPITAGNEGCNGIKFPRTIRTAKFTEFKLWFPTAAAVGAADCVVPDLAEWPVVGQVVDPGRDGGVGM